MERINKQIAFIVAVLIGILISITILFNIRKVLPNQLENLYVQKGEIGFDKKDTIEPNTYVSNLIHTVQRDKNQTNKIQSNIFIDEKVKDKKVLLASIQMKEDEYHLFSHGRSGELYINNKWLDKKEIINWFESRVDLNRISKIFIYGCEFGKGIKGKEAVSFIIEKLGVKVAASNNITGKEGDWMLEVGNEKKELEVPDYQYNLQNLISPYRWNYRNGAEFVNWSNHRAINLNNGYVNHGYIEQTINTIVGNRYTLIFKAHNHMTNGYRNPHSLTLNLRIGNVHNENIVLQSTPWRHSYTIYERTFVANSSSTIIRFQHYSGDTYEHDILICNDVCVPYVQPRDCQPVSACDIIGGNLDGEVEVGETLSYSVNGGTPSNNTTWRITPADGVNVSSGSGPNADNITFREEGNYTISFTKTNSTVPSGCTQNSSATCSKPIIVARTCSTGPDSDNDGVSDICDLDDDNDGILDIDECKTGTGDNLVKYGSFSIDPIPQTHWYRAVESSNFDTSIGRVYSYNMGSTYRNSSLTNGIFDEDTNPSTGIFNALQEMNGPTAAIVYKFQEPLEAGIIYSYSMDIGNRAFGDFDDFFVQIYNADTNKVEVEIVRERTNTLPGWTTTQSYKLFEGTFTVPTTGNYYILWRNEGFGSTEDDILIDRVAVKKGTACDTDGDTIPDSLDLDSDNDGIYDVVEAGTASLDTNNDGRIDSITSSSGDIDDDGLADIIEASNGNDQGTTPRETTSGIPDYINSDSDADGCSDANEGYNNGSIDGVGNTYYNPNNLPEPLTVTSGAINAEGKVVVASYINGDIPEVIDRDADKSICNNNTFAVSDFVNTNEGQTVIGNVLTNDYDLQGDIQSLKITPITNVSNGTLVLTSNGSFSYTPNAGFAGEDSFVYEVCDNRTPQACARASVFIEILPDEVPENEAPIANIDTGATNVNVSLSGNVLNNDYDPDGDALEVNIVPIKNVTNGTLVLNANGTFTYTPNIGFIGTDTFEYEVCDDVASAPLCDTAVVEIVVTPRLENSTIANDDAFITTADTADNNVTGNVLNNDFDPEGHTQVVNTAPLNNVSNGNLVLNSDGSFNYQPNAGFVGQDSFVYQVCDSGIPQACDQATVIVLVKKFSQPDYTISIVTNQTNVVGQTGVIDFVVFLGEVNGFVSNGINSIEFRIPDSSNFEFIFDNALITLNGQQVFNSHWAYILEKGLHKFIYTANGGIFKGNTFSKVGIKARFVSPANSRGKVPLKGTIRFNSGGQSNRTNDNDEDLIQYNNTKL
ncbi:Ig-like domain-containing protein [uncultured Tenacibaculum sp.]|uniref:Ig-like domain-containing protein n=1 Tax=uncultured Tenacibaculum sp. TaxID=174713 RepID=UPI002631DFA4|nr:Ig-like domain-containing protein [uncultured Tenacibaculum sp.]